MNTNMVYAIPNGTLLMYNRSASLDALGIVYNNPQIESKIEGGHVVQSTWGYDLEQVSTQTLSNTTAKISVSLTEKEFNELPEECRLDKYRINSLNYR